MISNVLLELWAERYLFLKEHNLFEFDFKDYIDYKMVVYKWNKRCVLENILDRVEKNDVNCFKN